MSWSEIRYHRQWCAAPLLREKDTRGNYHSLNLECSTMVYRMDGKLCLNYTTWHYSRKKQKNCTFHTNLMKCSSRQTYRYFEFDPCMPNLYTRHLTEDAQFHTCCQRNEDEGTIHDIYQKLNESDIYVSRFLYWLYPLSCSYKPHASSCWVHFSGRQS